MRLLYLFFAVGILIISQSFSSKSGEKEIEKNMKNDFSIILSQSVYMNDKICSVQSFYIANTETTNRQYAQFLTDLKARGFNEKIKTAQIDSIKWNMKEGFNYKYVDYYHNHPAYLDYPVVNISYEAAELFCEWLSEKYTTISASERKFLFRLPTRSEYISAARGSAQSVNYSWGTNSLRDEDGNLQCNFSQLGSENIHKNLESGLYEIKYLDNDFSTRDDIIAPAESYWKNEFGVYNLNGNVAEMLSEKGIAIGGSWRNTGFDVRIESEQKYTEANPMTGFRVVMTYIGPIK